MNSPGNKAKTNILSGFCLIGLLSIVSCVSDPEVTVLPDCNYSAHISVNEQVRDFIWRDKKHVTFHKDWQQSSLFEISNRYQYLQRKALADAVKAKNDIVWLESKLNNLQDINNNLLEQIEMNACNNQHAPQSPLVLKQQNAGIDYILSGLPDIANDIEAKKQKIISAIESK